MSYMVHTDNQWYKYWVPSEIWEFALYFIPYITSEYLYYLQSNPRKIINPDEISIYQFINTKLSEFIPILEYDYYDSNDEITFHDVIEDAWMQYKDCIENNPEYSSQRVIDFTNVIKNTFHCIGSPFQTIYPKLNEMQDVKIRIDTVNTVYEIKIREEVW